MLEIILEYRKGILFVRLVGSLNKKTVSIFKEKTLSIIEENEIKNIVLNFKYVDNIDFKGISIIYYLYEICKKGQILICGINNELDDKFKKNRIFNYMKKISSEFDAFNLMKV